MDDIQIQSLLDQGLKLATEYVPKVLLAVLTLIIGYRIIGWLKRVVAKQMEKSISEVTLRNFLIDLISIVLTLLLYLSVAGMVGIETSSFLAILGAAGLAVGLALQGSLQHLAGGVMILLFRPFKVGDLVEAQGFLGHVEAINLFVTSLITPDNKTVLVPNGAMVGDSITNYTAEGKLRVDLVVGISYNADIRTAREAIMEVMKNDPKVLQTPEPSVSVLELADSSVNLAVRPYCTPDDYWDVYFGITEKVKNALDAAGVEIPFPQQTVYEVKS